MLPDETTFSPTVGPGNVDSALTLDVPDHLRHGILRRDGHQQVHVIRHQVTLFDCALALMRQTLQNFPQILSKFSENRFPAFTSG